MDEVECYFGLGSRYSYLAFTQLSRIEATYGCSFILRPISSVELLELRGRSPFDGNQVSGQYAWDYRRRDAQAWASYYRVPFCEPRRLPDDHRLMARACHAAHLQGAMRPYCAALLAAIFVDATNIDAPACITIAALLGLDVKLMSDAMKSREVDVAVTATAKLALERGAFGVPTFFVDDRMFWGNDRLVLLEHHLATRGNNCGLTARHKPAPLDT